MAINENLNAEGQVEAQVEGEVQTSTEEVVFQNVDDMSADEISNELESLSKDLIERDFTFEVKLSTLKKMVKHIEKNGEFTHQTVTSYLNLLTELRGQADAFQKSSDVKNTSNVEVKVNYSLVYPVRDFMLMKGGKGYIAAKEYVDLINSVGESIDAMIIEFSHVEKRLRELHERLAFLQQEASANGKTLETSNDVSASASASVDSAE